MLLFFIVSPFVLSVSFPEDLLGRVRREILSQWEELFRKGVYVLQGCEDEGGVHPWSKFMERVKDVSADDDQAARFALRLDATAEGLDSKLHQLLGMSNPDGIGEMYRKLVLSSRSSFPDGLCEAETDFIPLLKLSVPGIEVCTPFFFGPLTLSL